MSPHIDDLSHILLLPIDTFLSRYIYDMDKVAIRSIRIEHELVFDAYPKRHPEAVVNTHPLPTVRDCFDRIMECEREVRGVIAVSYLCIHPQRKSTWAQLAPERQERLQKWISPERVDTWLRHTPPEFMSHMIEEFKRGADEIEHQAQIMRDATDENSLVAFVSNLNSPTIKDIWTFRDVAEEIIQRIQEMREYFPLFEAYAEKLKREDA